jgi:hypothetical protein
MADIINSFTETTNTMLDAVNIALEISQKTNEALTTQQDSVVVTVEATDPITGDPSITNFAIPSYNAVINKVNNARDTVDAFVKGSGVVLLRDGTYREVKANPIPISPNRITEVAAPTNFNVRSNWFFESLMFPQVTVQFDLKGKVDDRSDRIVVRRVIFDNFDDTETQWFLDNVANEERTYFEVTTLLQENSKKYWEDDEVHDLPLATEPYTGFFRITNKRTLDAKEWFYLDTLNYGIPSDDPVIYDLTLSKGDKLRFGQSTYKIDDLYVPEKRVQLIPLLGMDHPSKNKFFEIYSDPFSTKQTEIPVGYNECNVMFIKGVNDDYNIIADEWSNSISFYTSTLILTNTTDDLEKYYNENVADFGKQMEGQAKEKFIPAWFGIEPDAPTLNVEDTEVTQINTQLNAALDTDEIKNSQIQIESTKTIVNSLKSTIAVQKAELVALTDTAQRNDLNSKINTNVDDLAKRTVEYQSLVRSLSTIAYESDAVTATPKYRVRGFFGVPQGKRRSRTARPQEVIGFELSYRYLKMDNTGVALKSYETLFGTVGSGSRRKRRGVFSDWIIVSTPIKERVYDSSLGRYIWVQPDIADGDVVNVNQLDIPIRKGEKVQYRARSISEAGWPTNPIKSAWSEVVTKEFPSNLQSSDQVTNILTDAVTEETTIKLDETLNASGLITHISDEIPNPNAGSGTYFKHQAINLAFDLTAKDKSGAVTSTATTDLQTQLDNMGPNSYVTITKPEGSVITTPQLTGTIQKFFQAIANIDPSVYDEFDSLIG